MGRKWTLGRLKSSRTSLMVKAALEAVSYGLDGGGVLLLACMGPLRPTIFTELTLLLERCSKAWLAMSVFRRVSTSLSSMRATSRATFP